MLMSMPSAGESPAGDDGLGGVLVPTR
jgi:hypothetical protein